MSGAQLDEVAWASPWSARATGEKVLLSGGLLACAVGLPAWPTAPVCTAVALLLLLGPAGVPVRVLWRVAWALGGFIALGFLSLAVTQAPVTASPGLVWSWGALAVTRLSLGEAAGTTAHCVAGTCSMLLLATTTPMTRLLRWAGRRGVPATVVEVADLTYRFVFMLLDTLHAVHDAQAARLGYRDLRTSLRSSAQLGAVVLARAWDRARRLQDGLESRGYQGSLEVLDEAETSSPTFVVASLTLITAIATLGAAARLHLP